ncbi:rRNA pseudouridine synthase [Candidatus Saccharibacteria bacterium]|nr:rRNA pseudouridine synthase [Candidatus Saccharibacteria bacterium]
MRINQFVAQATGLSRRKADELIKIGSVKVNGEIANIGDTIEKESLVTLRDKKISLKHSRTILLNKPVGYVCSRDGQGSKTIYELIPKKYHDLKPIGRLDKDSSGLLLLSNDGELAQKLTHPKYQKSKVYLIRLNKPLLNNDMQLIKSGVMLSDGLSKLSLKGNGKDWQITMREGRNRQIRRTFNKLNYEVTKLHRIQFGSYKLLNQNVGSLSFL